MDLHNIREDYSKQALSEKECDPHPIPQFEKWLNEAIRSEVNEPTAVNVATLDTNGRPSSRMVLLKEVNPQGFVFFTNYQSQQQPKELKPTGCVEQVELFLFYSFVQLKPYLHYLHYQL